MYRPIAIRQQVVAGINYLVKIQVSADRYIHIRIFQPLPHTRLPPSVTGFEANKTLDEELAPNIQQVAEVRNMVPGFSGHF